MNGPAQDGSGCSRSVEFQQEAVRQVSNRAWVGQCSKGMQGAAHQWAVPHAVRQASTARLPVRQGSI